MVLVQVPPALAVYENEVGVISQYIQSPKKPNLEDSSTDPEICLRYNRL